MNKNYSRRDFLKLAGVGAASTAVLTGCGPASRYVKREPYFNMPEYTTNGLSTFYATTCRECAAGCGIVVRTMQGRAIKVEGNANHPVNLGRTCARGQATLHGLYNPDRIAGPVKRSARGSEKTESLDWDTAIQATADAISKTRPGELAFLLGAAPDHVFDLFSDLAEAIGAPAPIRFGALSMFEARATLSAAAENLFGQKGLPFFDLANSDFVLSFGANFLETWLSPVAYTRGYSQMRRGDPKRRGHFIQVEARLSQTGAKADEWLPVKPGTEGLVALAIGRLAAEAKGGAMPKAFAGINLADAASAAEVKLETLEHIAQMFAGAQNPLVIPGGAALAQSNGLAVAEAILTLNALAGNFGRPGGVFLSPLAPKEDEYHRPASLKEMADFVDRMKSGRVKTLFIHGVNPLFELPRSLGFAEALQNVEQVISFATFPDETAMQADYVFPDRHALESWGYQRVVTGTGQSALSGFQPVVSGVYQTDTKQLQYDVRSTVDVVLAAAQKVGGGLADALNFKDEVEYLQGKLASLVGEADGFFSAPEINTFMAYFQQYGGWWKTTDDLVSPSPADALNRSLNPGEAVYGGEGNFFLVPFVSPTLAEAGANKPWLQELPDPTTTVMWNTWVEINPKTAEELGIEDDDVVLILSEAGALEAPVYRYPGIRPDTIAIPFGQGHTAYGRYAAGRGVNPADLLSPRFNEAGDLAFAGMKVRVQKTGKRKHLARLEGKLGVYGFESE